MHAGHLDGKDGYEHSQQYGMDVDCLGSGEVEIYGQEADRDVQKLARYLVLVNLLRSASREQA